MTQVPARASTAWWWLGSLAAALALAPVACGSDDAQVAPGGATGSSGVGGGGGTGGGGELRCVIDGVVGPDEECDDGNQVSGDGCEADCSFTCTQGTVNGDAVCDDLDPCNGVETCAADHSCVPGTAVADGGSCGSAMICKAGVCEDDVCGDGFVSANEDCDDSNVVDGDGCDSCTFTCVSTDPNACTPADPCEGQGVCDDATHTCGAGTPLADDTACGTDAYCKSGVCKTVQCNDGVLEVGEECDDDNVVPGDGCEPDCTKTCSDPSTDCGAPPACQLYQCNASDLCEAVADTTQNGNTCGTGLECNNGACIAPGAVCGNGNVENGEDCDFGTGFNGAGTGCELNCKFSCTMAPDSCPDADTCNGAESCIAVTVNSRSGQACQAGTPLADCTACNGGLCKTGSCQLTSCGDGCVDPGNNETCEPPNTPTCSAACTVIDCGNGTREAGEQCDDGNTTNLDGCDDQCNFEQDERINWLEMQWGTDAACGANALGGAIVGGTAQGQLQQSLDDGIADGSISVLTAMLGLDDLTGTSDPSVTVGIVNGSPDPAAGYDGTADLDWWYYADPLSLDANRRPTATLPGSISAKMLTAGPGALSIDLILAGSTATLSMSDVTITATIGATSMPTASAGGPPGHLASENLDPALVSYENAGQPNSNGAGNLCGRVSAESLAQVPIPDALAGGFFGCSQGYSTDNSLLDALIGGCNVFFIQQIAPTQPDTHDSTVADVGSGPLYTLEADANTKAVNGCRDMSGASVNLADCLKDAAYSAYFKFATGRVIIK